MTPDEQPENDALQPDDGAAGNAAPDADSQPPVRRVKRDQRKRRLKAPRDLFAGADVPDDEVEPEPDTPETDDSIPDEPTAPDIYDTDAVDRALDALDRFGRPIVPVAGRYPPVDPAREMADEQDPTVEGVPEKQNRPRRQRKGLYNAIALFFFAATLFMCGYYSILWNNPWSPLNPLPPATPFIEITATPDSLAAMTAPTQLPAPATDSAPPRIVTPTLPPDASSIAPAELAPGAFAFVLAADEILYTPNANGRACDWSSIAGTVTGLDGAPINNYGIQITDTEDPAGLDRRVFSGSALTFGPGGFELSLGGVPQQGRYRVQLFSPAGVAVSDTYDVFTSDQCDQNVVVIQFRQVAPL